MEPTREPHIITSVKGATAHTPVYL